MRCRSHVLSIWPWNWILVRMECRWNNASFYECCGRLGSRGGWFSHMTLNRLCSVRPVMRNGRAKQQHKFTAGQILQSPRVARDQTHAATPLAMSPHQRRTVRPCTLAPCTTHFTNASRRPTPDTMIQTTNIAFSQQLSHHTPSHIARLHPTAPSVTAERVAESPSAHVTR